MTEKRATYGQPLLWQVTASFYVHTSLGRTREYSGYTWEFAARDALDASAQAIQEIKRRISPGSTVFTLILAVSLVGVDKNEGEDP